MRYLADPEYYSHDEMNSSYMKSSEVATALYAKYTADSLCSFSIPFYLI